GLHETREYFYAASEELKFDKQRRRAFTWTQGACDDSTCQWEIKPVYEDEKGNKYYTIKNLQYGEYLYAAVDKLKYREPNQHDYILNRRKRDTRHPQMSTYHIDVDKT
uniref:CSON011149 protein n=1 Tax=Culicoides sonorensis TaxID=179676 RepID=A0A336MZK0_CULSO